VEGNDSADKATAFTKWACGSLSASSDVDFFKFSMPNGYGSFSSGFEGVGGVTVNVILKGKTYPLQSNATIPLEAGSDYYIEVRPDSAQTTAPYPRNYRVRFQFTPN
jgi:hypothetical protein